MTKEDNQIHKSVLLQESIRGLEVKSGEIFLDCTLGAGGHSLFVAKETNNKAIIIGIDADGKALESAGEKIKNAGAEFYGFNGNFRNLDQALDKNKIQLVDKVLFDFGLSSDQLDESGRGFSFRFNEPLLMTLKDTPAENDLTASDVVNGFEQKNLEDIIRGFGEEQFAGRIARVIVERRQEKPIETTFELAEIITEAIPARFRKGKIHPATKTFQAIRMAVNGELDAIGEGLEKAFERLNKKGRIATISFHSLEDRIVKQYFKKLEKDGVGKILTKKPIAPSLDEIKENPRSRSAKLRIIEKI